ncbi:phage tail domain-containing protein [Staphylococcus gallinarum]|uniref:phage tail domain-containing protein n=1 Tax=Staphylococcus gallinarum TaxID=1293 RepID=UPI001E594493|nr:phage tail domain-containing protein [Staphylococcus gallinarum]MCD8872132.1 phage tail family protein [Staphylococcus gallinarum]
MKKEVKLITNDKTINLTDFDNFIYLDFVENDVQMNTNTTEINGVDGVLTGASNFAPFDLELNFIFLGVDIKDYHLFKSKLRSIVYQRDPYYVWHSDMPGKKYAVLPSATEIEDLYSRNGKVTLKFSVFKGYSESLYLTDQFSLGDGKWQFENGLVPDSDIKYKHTRTLFEIFNGSSDTIDPRYSHKLKIRIRLATETGFKVINKETGDVFEYTGKLKANQSFVIDGGYAYKDKKRCGRQTNHGILRLAPGYNTFEVWGKISDFEIEFVFPFIYR